MLIEEEIRLPPLVTFRCEREGCGKTVTRKRSHFTRSKHHYCSRECQDAGFKERTEIVFLRCTNCGKGFERARSYIRKVTKNHYCNRECYSQWRASQRMSDREYNILRNERRWLRYQNDSAYREHCRNQRRRKKRKVMKKK